VTHGKNEPLRKGGRGSAALRLTPTSWKTRISKNNTTKRGKREIREENKPAEEMTSWRRKEGLRTISILIFSWGVGPGEITGPGRGRRNSLSVRFTGCFDKITSGPSSRKTRKQARERGTPLEGKTRTCPTGKKKGNGSQKNDQSRSGS